MLMTQPGVTDAIGTLLFACAFAMYVIRSLKIANAPVLNVLLWCKVAVFVEYTRLVGTNRFKALNLVVRIRLESVRTVEYRLIRSATSSMRDILGF